MAALSPDTGSRPAAVGPPPVAGAEGATPSLDGAPIALSVIVPVRNGATTIEEQLEALVTQQWDEPWEIVIVDNGSTDGTLAIAQRFAARDARITLVEADERHSVAYVRNVGVASSRGTAVAFADADDIVAPGWVAAIGTALAEHALVGSHLEHERLNATGTSSGQTEEVGRFFGLPCLSGAGHGVQRWLYDELGGNDENWSGAGEDFDFAFRAALDAHVEPVFVDDALYHYRRRTDARSAFRQTRRYGQSHVRLYKQYGNGDPAHRDPTALALKIDLWLLLHVYQLAQVEHRLTWARRAGTRFGRIEGSIRYRTLFL